MIVETQLMLLALVVGLKKCPFIKITTDEVLYIPTHAYCTHVVANFDRSLWRHFFNGFSNPRQRSKGIVLICMKNSLFLRMKNGGLVADQS